MITKTCAFFVLACTVAVASAKENAEAFKRADHLRRGINTSIWFAQSTSNYTVDRLRTFTTEDDLKLIQRLGFDHIRLSVDADPLTGWAHHTPQGEAFMQELDRVVSAATQDGLAVIVDIHPESRYKQQLLQGGEGVDHFISLWRMVAAHFKGTDPKLVFFEIMNEPEQSDAYRWQGIEGAVAWYIRQAAPEHTIIAAGAHYSGLDDLLQLQPLALDNVIYTFHDYEPFPFTHQGATWTDSRVEPLRNVPYPSTPENVQPNMEQEQTLLGQFFVEQYGLDRWDARRVDSTLSFAEKWSQLHHVPVYCGEFGVHRPYVAEQDRVAWLRDMRVALERHHIGWAMWDYQTNFGAVTKQNGQTTPDSLVIGALGLTPK